jgi:hypothetical protein
MKYTLKIIAMLFLLLNFSCKAQSIVPLETRVNYHNSLNGIPETITYFKDINHLLDKYVGNWKGTFNNRNFEFIITKNTTIYDGLSEDRLLIRFLITTDTGTIIEDTRAELDDKCSITGDYIENSYYALYYFGGNSQCGQSGTVFITMVKNTNNSQMKLFLEQDHVLLPEETCPNGRAAQVLPLEQITLTKS